MHGILLSGHVFQNNIKKKKKMPKKNWKTYAGKFVYYVKPKHRKQPAVIR